MRKYLLLTTALAALIAVSVAGLAFARGGNKPVTVRVGNLIVKVNGGFSPKALSRTKQTPIAFNASGEISTADGTHPPALTEAIIETDKNGAINVKGYPTCKPGLLVAQDTAQAKKKCKPAIIGTGTTNVSIEFAESAPVPVHSQLLVFNGGEHGGVTTLYIHAYITVPVPAAIVTTVKITKVHNGRYGLKSIATIPKIAGGSGSVTSFNLTINKKFTYKGKKVSVLTAKCADGKLQAHVEAIFHNYAGNGEVTKASAGIIRTCTPKG